MGPSRDSRRIEAAKVTATAEAVSLELDRAAGDATRGRYDTWAAELKSIAARCRAMARRARRLAGLSGEPRRCEKVPTRHWPGPGGATLCGLQRLPKSSRWAAEAVAVTCVRCWRKLQEEER